MGFSKMGFFGFVDGIFALASCSQSWITQQLLLVMLEVAMAVLGSAEHVESGDADLNS
jgi:hypothetical protein